MDGPHKHVLTKYDLVKSHIYHHKYNIFGISETWLDNNKLNDDLIIDGHLEPIRQNNNHNQGGVLVYHTSAKHRNEFEPPGSEILTVDVHIKREKVLVCNCYTVIEFCADIESIIDKPLPEFKHFIHLYNFYYTYMDLG